MTLKIEIDKCTIIGWANYLALQSYIVFVFQFFLNGFVQYIFVCSTIFELCILFEHFGFVFVIVFILFLTGDIRYDYFCFLLYISIK